MSLSYWWSKEFLASRSFLWLLLISNVLGTIYGYIWYEDQMKSTVADGMLWQVIFVPDSPTASLFFCLAIGFLLISERRAKSWGLFREIIEALAVVTSIKYGIWAVTMIFAGAYQGQELVWQDWMLVISHSAMAVEALLYIRLFKFGSRLLIGAGLWTLLNDTIDYTYEVYPYLPTQLWNDVGAVQNFTIMLTLFSVLISWIVVRQVRT
ncbi:putative membrane protein YpjA [Paenibacillus shirakamiensis]|uniref:Membrane protein YpjA n=1 Tax=Paenibacillus shirakamiensis TaxID=1265935 RepID=A0ABS4JCX6_9BACL|nr:DUF1405 domain-containing protein [Paenibacillus shirakamiensis]MBP1999564.1 putative membrane protein YpjA [Paenibacillus shirakamiensis]